MRKNHIVAAATLLCGLCVGCSMRADPSSRDSDDGIDREATQIDVVAPEPREATHMLTEDAALRLRPSAAHRTDNPFRKGTVTNGKGFVRRGTEVAVLDKHGEFSRVVTSRGATGWILTRRLAERGTVTEATVLKPTVAYAAPYSHSRPSAAPLPPGELLLVGEHVEGFVQVKTEAGGTVWIPHGALVEDPAEVAVSKLMARVRWQRRAGLGPFYSIWNEAMNTPGSASLLPALDELIGSDR